MLKYGRRIVVCSAVRKNLLPTRKKEHLKNVAARYQETHDGLPLQWRIDFVAVELDREREPKPALRLSKTP